MNQEDFMSGTWKRFTAQMNDRLASLRTQNDAAQSPEQTATIRGKIAEVKRILALQSAMEGGGAEGDL